jgi:hypothetical protein
MKKTFHISCVLLLFISFAVFSSEATAKKTPDWIEGTSAKYPEPRFFIGVGAVSMDKGGENQQINWASDRARAEIAKTIRSKVEATTTASRTVTSGGGRPESISTQTDIVTASTNEILEGVEIKSYYRDKKSRMLYALAVLDRPKAARKIQNETLDLKNRILSEMEEGKYYQEKDEFLLSIRHYNNALNLAGEAKSKNELAAVLDPSVLIQQNEFLNYETGINQILSGLKKRIRFDLQLAGPASGVRTYMIRGLTKGGFKLSGEAEGVKTYVLDGTTDLTYKGEMEMDPKLTVQIYQADLDLEIKDPQSKETVGALTWSVSANEKSGEMASKSAVRALGRTVENDIVKKILDLF